MVKKEPLATKRNLGFYSEVSYFPIYSDSILKTCGGFSGKKHIQIKQADFRGRPEKYYLTIV
jgi:hypothetical protein